MRTWGWSPEDPQRMRHSLVLPTGREEYLRTGSQLLSSNWPRGSWHLCVSRFVFPPGWLKSLSRATHLGRNQPRPRSRRLTVQQRQGEARSALRTARCWETWARRAWGGASSTQDPLNIMTSQPVCPFVFIHGRISNTSSNFYIQPLKSWPVSETHPSNVLFKELPLVLAVENTSLKILKVLQEYSPEDVFIEFLLKTVSETLSFSFKLLCCKCVPNDEIAIYLTFKSLPLRPN